MDFGRGLHPNAHVRSSFIVKIYERSYHFFCLIHIVEPLPWINELLFYDAVDAFRNTVVCGIGVLCHADHNVVFPQFGDIQVAAVLRPAVGMVDDVVQIVAPRLCNCLHQSLFSVHCSQRIRQRPPENFSRIRIGYQMKITVLIAHINVGDVRHPHFVRPHRHNFFVKVGVLVEAVV